MSAGSRKSLDSSPDETRIFEKRKIDLANFSDDVTIGRAIFEPGWSWEKCVKPIAKTNSCQAPYTMYIISGRMKVVMDDGTEAESGHGDAVIVPPRHNAWVVGNESYVAIDFTGAKD
jgi:mannose-6-phosphate isomerase-like protein (cupin superfamily)